MAPKEENTTEKNSNTRTSYKGLTEDYKKYPDI